MKLGFIWATIHFLVVILIAIYTYVSDSIYAESCTPLIPLYILDLPSSLVLILLNFVPSEIVSDVGLPRDFYIPVAVFALFGSVQYFLIGAGIGLIYRKLKKEPTKVLTETRNETEWSATPKIAFPLPSKIVKYIKWISISIAILLILSITVIISSDDVRHSLLWMNSNVALFSGFLFPLVIVLIGYFLIYPKFQYDFWIQRFLGGIILFSFHLLPAYLGIRSFFSLLWHFDSPAYILIYILAYILFISPFIVMVLLCFFLKKKTKSLTEKTKKIYKNMLLFPLGASILNFFLFLVPFAYIKLLNVSFFPLLTLTIGIPAVINGYQMPKKLLFLSYVGIGVAHLFLVIGWYMLLGWLSI